MRGAMVSFFANFDQWTIYLLLRELGLHGKGSDDD